MLEQGPDFWCWFDKTQFSYHCVHPIHAKMFSIQILLHFSQIASRVCTLMLFIIIITIIIVVIFIIIIIIVIIIILLLILLLYILYRHSVHVYA